MRVRFFLSFMSMALIAGCGQTLGSKLDVTNGKTTLGYPAVVRIASTKGACTGTFIKPNVLVTAAHCAVGIQAPLVVTKLMKASSKTVIHPDYDAGKNTNDVALIFFPMDLTDATMPLQAQLPQAGDPVTLVGFGDNHYINATDSAGSGGLKRVGSNVIASVGTTGIVIVGSAEAFPAALEGPTGTNSAGAHGDSGSPLLNAAGEIIGIDSTGINDNGAASSNYIPIATVNDFIQKSLADADLYTPAPFLTYCAAHRSDPTIQIMADSTAEDLDGSCYSIYSTIAENGFAATNRGSDRKVFDLSVLTTMPWMVSLQLSDYSLTNLDAIAQITGLTSLTLRGSGIADLNFLTRNYALFSLYLVGENSSIDPAPLAQLPNLFVIFINNKLIPANSTVGASLQGSWQRVCSAMGGSAAKLFASGQFEYNPKHLSFKERLTIFGDADCQGEPAAIFTTEASLAKIMPTADPTVFSVDLSQADNSIITIFKEQVLPQEILQGFKTGCPYTLTQPTPCRITTMAPEFTIFKITDGQVFTGADDDAKLYTGDSEANRQRELDPIPFVRSTTPVVE